MGIKFWKHKKDPKKDGAKTEGKASKFVNTVKAGLNAKKIVERQVFPKVPSETTPLTNAQGTIAGKHDNLDHSQDTELEIARLVEQNKAKMAEYRKGLDALGGLIVQEKSGKPVMIINFQDESVLVIRKDGLEDIRKFIRKKKD